MNMKITVLALSVITLCLFSGMTYAGQPGTADMVFNRRFSEKLTPMMSYDQLVKSIGTEGAKVGEDKRSSPPALLYHWNGERKSALDARVAAGKVVEATVTSPKNKKFSINRSN
ncbi:MAG: hypothetical protein PHY09_12955 [Desulfuromonadaceae bacterium]|nr:hypothetical protein [Desulfuromonadaceae bacterium]MDD5105012.1 hypothetical protein [Desulfuromonadaceae bacterium]